MSNNNTSINKIIKEIEHKKLKQLYNEFNNVIELISKFIIKKKLILYGGFVINLILPKKYKFYKEYTINDYDCFSENPIEDSMILAKEIKKSGFKYIKIKRAIHKNTYKISVFGKQFFDITFLDSNVYKILLNYINTNNYKLKYYKDNYKIIPIEIIKQNLYYELARPIQSGFRWEKIYNRLLLINKFYPTEKNNKVLKCIPIKNTYLIAMKYILEYIKLNKIPIIDSYAIKIYKNLALCCYRLSNTSICITILVNDINDVYKNIKNIIFSYVNSKYKIKLLKKSVNSINIYKHFDIKIYDEETKEVFNIIRIIEIKNQCFSTIIKNGYNLGSIDTCLYFLYYNYVNNKIYYNNTAEALENIYYINIFEDNIINEEIKGTLNKRLQTNCYGELNYESELKELWNKRLTLKYI